ncbi:hypothetical protein MTR67_011279 [Solanum verrucosum]|uniref:Uncharacterized protein n=1 Tax=Solanum verrucosum TaxID=315347 RepID=A0AAF0Q6H8_SOLVR|nr:hypothetical protein MTR67_011279 [Solanum verrucosum]
MLTMRRGTGNQQTFALRSNNTSMGFILQFSLPKLVYARIHSRLIELLDQKGGQQESKEVVEDSTCLYLVEYLEGKGIRGFLKEKNAQYRS